MKKQTSLYINEELLKKLKILSIYENVNVNTLIIRFIEEGLKNK